jgi:hypothetical protein
LNGAHASYKYWRKLTTHNFLVVHPNPTKSYSSKAKDF